MRKLTAALIITTLVIASGCAKSPGSIAPMVVKASEYVGMGCQTLEEKYSSTVFELAGLSKEQDEAASLDVAQFAMFGVLSLLTGPSANFEEEIAKLKGEEEALAIAMSFNKCSGLALADTAN
jgi:hypothetical protein